MHVYNASILYLLAMKWLCIYTCIFSYVYICMYIYAYVVWCLQRNKERCCFLLQLNGSINLSMSVGWLSK